MIVSTAALFAAVAALHAGPIFQGTYNAGWQIDHFEPIGQSFTAEDANILAIGFNVFDVNQHVGPLNPLTVSLYDGAGMAGTLLGTADLQGVVPNYDGWLYADFSFVSLAVGNVYTASLSTLSARGGIRGANGDPYAGGTGYLFGGPQAGIDLMFHVIPGANVPDSSVALPFALTLAGLALARRRRLA